MANLRALTKNLDGTWGADAQRAFDLLVALRQAANQATPDPDTGIKSSSAVYSGVDFRNMWRFMIDWGKDLNTSGGPNANRLELISVDFNGELLDIRYSESALQVTVEINPNQPTP